MVCDEMADGRLTKLFDWHFETTSSYFTYCAPAAY